jgi:hypothetical protein
MIKPKEILSWAVNKPSRSITRRRRHARLKKAIDKNEPTIGSYPLNVQIETTSLCNGKCRFCAYQGSWNQENPGTMSWKTYEKIILNLKKYEIDTFYPYGGNEPLLDKELFKRIRYAVENLHPRCVELSTNLSLLNSTMLEEIKGLFPGPNHKIVVSFHGVSKESYEDQMGLDYDRSLKNVLSLIKLSQDVPLRIMIHGTSRPRKNTSDLKCWFDAKAYASYWSEKLSGFKVKPEISYFEYHNWAGMKQMRPHGKFFRQVYRRSLKDFYCPWFDRFVFFLYTGEAALCCMDFNRETALGRSIENQTLEEMFCSDDRIDLIKKGMGLTASEKDFICKMCSDPFE